MTKDKEIENILNKPKKERKKVICKECGKEVGNLAAHLRTHKMTLIGYLEKHDSFEFMMKEVVNFLDKFYIDGCYRKLFLQYDMQSGQAYTVSIEDNLKSNEEQIIKHFNGELSEISLKRKYPLNTSDLRKHIEGRIAFGVKFRPTSSKLIGLDIDVRDTSILKMVHDRLIEIGITENEFLMTDSGGKGYHVDIFLNAPVSPVLIQKFYDEQIIGALSKTLKEFDLKKAPHEIIELRGASQQGYRLPLGTHPSKKKPCYPVDINGTGSDNIKITYNIIKSKATMESSKFAEIVNVKAYKPLLTIEQEDEIEEITEGVRSLEKYSNTVEERAKKIEKILAEGLHSKGNRNETLYQVALYLKDYKELCLKDAREFLTDWVDSKWSKDIVDKEVRQAIKSTTKSAYNNPNATFFGAKEVKISTQEMKQILELTTKNKLQTKALRRLYYVLLIHHKAYSNKEGSFCMTYEQMKEAGGVSETSKAQIRKYITLLEEMGKLLVLKKGSNITGKGTMYKLLEFQEIIVPVEKTFKICNNEIKCFDCMEKAACHLLSDRERSQFVKGKDFKQLSLCDFNL